MGWLFIGALFADSKISLLVNLIFFTIIIAVVLILFEKKLVKKHETKKEDDLLNYKVSDFVSKVGKGHTPSERLSIINAVAKTSFSEWFGLKTNVSYTYLSDYFEKRGLPKYHNFCNKMFELFYSANSYSFAEVDRMTKLFVDLIRETFELRKAKVMQEKHERSTPESKKEGVKKPDKRAMEKSTRKKKPENRQLTWSDMKFKKEVEKKQKEVVFQRRKNVELMKEAEEKLKEQKKLEEELKQSLEEKELNVGKSKTKKIVAKEEISKVVQENSKVPPISVNKKIPQDFTKWYKEINLEPVMGKSWLKDYRKKKREGDI